MKNALRMAFVFPLTLLTGCALSVAGTTRNIVVKDRHMSEIKYLVQVPEGYDPAGPPLPLIFFLHGAGERGDDLAQVLAHGPPMLIAQGRRKFPAIVVSPQCPKDRWWGYESEPLLQVLAQVKADYRVDPKRVYLTGCSMGGYGAIALAARDPKQFAAVVAVCGGGNYFDALRLSRTPFWGFHGGKDPLIPVEESKRMVEIIKAHGGQARLTLYPDAGHDAWTAAYDDEALWTWLFQQHL